MKFFKSIVFALLGILTLAITSCNNSKTYAERLRDEKKAINLFIAKNNFEVLKSFPADGKFESNEFYKDPNTGVYLNIINYGDTSSMPQWRENVYIRFKGLHYFASDDTTRYSNLGSTFPEKLQYIGPVSSSTQSSYATPGWAVPISYVGHLGKVKLIIPFEMGSSYDQSQFEPTYYEQVEYRFESKW